MSPKNLLLAVALVLLAVLSLGGCGDDAPQAMRAGARASMDFVSDTRCADCHAYEFERWTGSQHDLAMQIADPTTVLGDFDDAVFEHAGDTTRFYKDGERFLVHTAGPDGALTDYEVRYTFGVAPLQQYLIEFDGGKLQCLTIAWDTENERWFTLYPDERIAAGDPLHWTGRYQRWNAMCAECHSTDLQKHYDLETDSYETDWKEIDVGCQACHGPGSAHVAWAEEHAGDSAYGNEWNGLGTRLARHAQKEQIDACAPCHSRRVALDSRPEIGAAFLDNYLPERLHAGYYFPDGQILDEVYVYGSFAQSKMYLRGVACTDCHDPHNLELLSSGNGLCTQCHSTQPPLDRFPDLAAKDYDTPAHHRHPEGSEGALCVNCHMPERTYMVVDPRRDHSFRIPRPDFTALLGTPNACNGCHTDQSAEWAADAIVEWFGEERPRHFAPIFAAAQAGHPDAVNALTAVSQSPDSTPIVRATALELLRPYGTSALQSVLAGLDDDDGLVRAAAVGGLDRLTPQLRDQLVVPMLGPSLDDPVRAVRIEAARVFSQLPDSAVPEANRASLEAATAEFLAAQAAQADMPASHLNLGVFHVSRGDTRSAEAEYRTALRLDPSFLPARFNLANLLNGEGRNADAEEVLRGGLTAFPAEGELHFSLALLLAEMGRVEDAAAAMQQAARLLPGRPRVHYNLGLLLQQLGRIGEAESVLITAVSKDENDPDPVHALVLIYIEQGEWQRAVPFAEKLVELVPRDPNARQLLEHVKTDGRAPLPGR